VDTRYLGFEFMPLRQRVSDVRHSPGITAQSARVGAIRPRSKHASRRRFLELETTPTDEEALVIAFVRSTAPFTHR
jgi:hypothetical protein